MPRTRERAADSDKPDEYDNPAESEEGVDLDGDNEVEETMEVEVEYEEVEEEEEVEEIEEEEEEEEEEEDEDEEGATEVDAQKHTDNDEEEDEGKKHAELLALPPHGSEVYLGGLPHDSTEEDLRGFCEPIGEVKEVRIMKGKDSGEAKGYAFATFGSKELASKAIEELNNTELMGRKIRCSTSQANHRLFIGNVPRSWEEEDMKKIVQKIGPGVISVELLKVCVLIL